MCLSVSYQPSILLFTWIIFPLNVSLYVPARPRLSYCVPIGDILDTIKYSLLMRVVPLFFSPFTLFSNQF